MIYTHTAWPFFDDEHRALARDLEAWCARELDALAVEPHSGPALDAACRDLVRRLGEGGWLRYAVGGHGGPPPRHGGSPPRHGGSPPQHGQSSLPVRALCLIRETLARHSPLAEFAFAMQGLGTGPITLYGTDEQRARYLPGVRDGSRIAAFAISEAQAGSDVGAMQTTARREGDGYTITGEKTWISNAGVADQYIVFARLPEAGARGYAAFVVEANNPGLRVTHRIETLAPHPLGALRIEGCRVPAGALIGEAGKGLRVALGTLDVFRATVGAAALGMARRAMDEALAFARDRQAFGQPLAEFQLIKAKLADMATAIDASALLVYRAAWSKDAGAERVTREAAMAKLYATEAAQRVIDEAVQVLGGRGVVAGSPLERLYREIRALRIYEGTSEIQRLVIGDQVLASEQ